LESVSPNTTFIKNMKTVKLILIASALSMYSFNNGYAQVDSVRTSTTVTTTTTTGTGTAAPAETPAPPPAAAPAQEPAERRGGDDYGKFYLGARFLPTFTKFDVTTLDNGTAKTTFVMGYGFGGLIGVNVSRHVGIQLEVLYSTLSQKFTDRNLERRIDLSYVHFPLLLVLNTDVSRSVNLNVAVGPQFGINTGSSLDTDDGPSTDTVQAVIAVKPGDFGLAYGAGLDFKLSPSLTFDIGFRGVYGILDISDGDAVNTTNQHYILDRSKVKTYAGYAGIKVMF
jgi:opacity protein-like surface antigen